MNIKRFFSFALTIVALPTFANRALATVQLRVTHTADALQLT
jgi:hypothetical protein